MNKNLLKKLFTPFLTLLILNISFTKIYCFDIDNFDFDSMDIDLDMLNNAEIADPSNIPTRAISDIFDKLVPVISAINTPLWNQTKPPKGRDTLYLIPHRISSLEYGGLIFNIFFNYTDKMAFSIDEALKLDTNQNALNELTEALVENLDSKEASSIIPLFKKLTIQEIKAGGLIQLGFTFESFRCEIDTSLQFSERNFWLDERDQDRIKEMFSDTNSTFDDKELYKYKFGMGDTRIKLGLNTLNMSNFQIDLGFEGILPTSEFSTDPRLKQYEINLENLQNDIPDILRSIRDNLLTPQLGNFGHFGLGCYFESKVDMFHNSLHLWNRLSFDNLFSAKEDRLIPSKRTIDQVDLVRLANDKEYATLFIKEFIFPPSYKVTMQPGDIVNFVSTLSFELGKEWRFATGYDYYHQQKEQFETIHTTEDLNSLRIDAASSPSATQHKIFAEGNYIQRKKGWDLILGAGGDYTISSKNLGHDWTLFLRIGAAF
ncbi:MAG: hypothetical protein ABIF12_00045 [bacterium]